MAKTDENWGMVRQGRTNIKAGKSGAFATSNFLRNGKAFPEVTIKKKQVRRARVWVADKGEEGLSPGHTENKLRSPRLVKNVGVGDGNKWAWAGVANCR